MLISVIYYYFCYTMVDIAFGTDRFELVDSLNCSVMVFGFYHLLDEGVEQIPHLRTC